MCNLSLPALIIDCIVIRSNTYAKARTQLDETIMVNGLMKRDPRWMNSNKYRDINRQDILFFSYLPAHLMDGQFSLKNSLTKSAMARKFPTGVLYGPDLYEGLNIKQLYYSQGITQLMACIQECAILSQTGRFIQTSAKDLMLELGYPVTLGTLNYKVAMDYLIPCWYGHIAKFVPSQLLDVKGKFSQL